MSTHTFPLDKRQDGHGFALHADKAGQWPGGGGLLESHLKQCDADGDGQSGWKKMNSQKEAIGAGVGPAEQPASQEAGRPGCPGSSHS